MTQRVNSGQNCFEGASESELHKRGKRGGGNKNNTFNVTQLMPEDT